MNHRDYLIALANGLSAAGFTRVRVADDDLARLVLEQHGAGALADETLAVDDATQWRANLRVDGLDRSVTLGILCCNDPEEIVYDYSANHPAAGEALDAVLSRLYDPIEASRMLGRHGD